MKNKYVIISGFACSEESDMAKLSKYASRGWILDSIVGGFFYKLRKDKPQNIIYNLDYQSDTNEDYFKIFEEAGWKFILSVKDHFHIFSAIVGTKLIYSDSETETDKYTRLLLKMKKGIKTSSMIFIILILAMILTIFISRPLFIFIWVLLLIDITIFTFNLIPYLSYKDRIKQIKINQNYKSMSNRKISQIYLFTSVLFLISVISDFIINEQLSIIFSLLTILTFYLSFNYYKKHKKSLSSERNIRR